MSTAVQQGVQKLLSEQKLRPAMQPEVELGEAMSHGKDAEVKVRLEALPGRAESRKIDGLKLERLTVEADDAAVDEADPNLASAQKSWTERRPRRTRRRRATWSSWTFVGTVDGEEFEGGTGEGMSVELGSGR